MGVAFLTQQGPIFIMKASALLIVMIKILVVLTVMGYAFGCLEPPCCRMVCSCQRANSTDLTSPVDCTCSARACSGSFIDNCQNSCKAVGPGISSDEEFRCGCFCKMNSVSE